MVKKLTKEQFVEKSIKKHGLKYNYDKVVYVNNSTPVIVVCQVHGDFLQKPEKHFRGHGCGKCSNHVPLTKSVFIERSIEMHGIRYNYNEVEFIDTVTKVKIGCPIHGWFYQVPSSHMVGCGCGKCEGKHITTEDFIKKSREIHGNLYNYGQTIYKTCNVVVEIECKKHGIFKQTPNTHLRGGGCSICGHERGAYAQRLTTEEFIKRAMIVHGNRFGYDKTIYETFGSEVVINCKKHGYFKQKVCVHLNGGGCQKCIQSKGEIFINRFLEENNIPFTPQQKFFDCKYVNQLPFDFYIHHLNLLVEFDGIQHFKPVDIFGGERAFNELTKRDATRTNFCKNQAINLLRLKDKPGPKLENKLKMGIKLAEKAKLLDKYFVMSMNYLKQGYDMNISDI